MPVGSTKPRKTREEIIHIICSYKRLELFARAEVHFKRCLHSGESLSYNDTTLSPIPVSVFSGGSPLAHERPIDGIGALHGGNPWFT